MVVTNVKYDKIKRFRYVLTSVACICIIITIINQRMMYIINRIYQNMQILNENKNNTFTRIV